MGVHGLWDLLAPVGRRVSVETLAGKRLAIGEPLRFSIPTLIMPDARFSYDIKRIVVVNY